MRIFKPRVVAVVAAKVRGVCVYVCLCIYISICSICVRTATVCLCVAAYIPRYIWLFKCYLLYNPNALMCEGGFSSLST